MTVQEGEADDMYVCTSSVDCDENKPAGFTGGPGQLRACDERRLR